MSILLLTEVFPPRTGGSGRWFWETYRRLPREEVVIAAGEDPRQGEFDQTHDMRVARLPLGLSSWGLLNLSGLWGYGRAIARLERLARAEQVDAVHCGRCLPEGLMALGLKHALGLPYVCYVHGEEMNYAITSRELRWLCRRVIHESEFVIANSRNTERLLMSDWGIPARSIKIMHPGVDASLFVPAHRDAAVRDRLGWGERPVVLTVGRLQQRKGHDRLIAALPSIRRAVPDVLYAIVGDGDDRPSLQSLAARLELSGHVQFLGEVDDDRLVQCYQQCDLFVLPNRQVGQDIEGFGIVLLEAQACGKPVVAGASGGTSETMKIPETGRIVPCEQPGPLAEVVTELLLDHEARERMGDAARGWVVERFDWSALSRQARRVFSGEVAVDEPEALIGESRA